MKQSIGVYLIKQIGTNEYHFAKGLHKAFLLQMKANACVQKIDRIYTHATKNCAKAG